MLQLIELISLILWCSVSALLVSTVESRSWEMILRSLNSTEHIFDLSALCDDSKVENAGEFYCNAADSEDRYLFNLCGRSVPSTCGDDNMVVKGNSINPEGEIECSAVLAKTIPPPLGIPWNLADPMNGDKGLRAILTTGDPCIVTGTTH
eukprot:Lankesteria_metandrocarpae@DN9818_c0_g1_i1.p1